MQNNELLPCPFCGGKPSLITNGCDFAIICNKCKLAFQGYISENSAIKKWNIRVQSNWQPIKTAPKTGKKILYARAGTKEIGIVYWLNAPERWQPDEQPFGEKYPTHWMRLPLPPEIKGQKS